MNRHDLVREEVIQRIEQAKGNLAAVARSFGVSRTTVWRYAEERATVKQALEEARETMLDNAESVLYKKVLDADMTAVIFFLKTQGKRRGYTERQEITGSEGGPIEHKDAGDTAERLLSRIDSIAARLRETSSANGAGTNGNGSGAT